MKAFAQNFFIALCLFPLFSSAQFVDNFSDGDFTSNPVWSGNTTSFDINGNMLHSNGPQASSVIYLSTPSTLMDSAEWNFLIRLDFNPSSTNQVRVFLASNQQDLSGSLNGYFVQFGETGTAPDSLDIFRQTGGTVTKVFTGVSGVMTSATSNSVRIRVVRHVGGLWDVFADKTGGNNLNAEGSFTDNTYTTTGFFGVVCDYATASRYNLFYFDDFSVGYIVADTTKPVVSAVSVLSSTAIDVKFSEPVEAASAQNTAAYSVNSSIGNPVSAIRDASDFSLVHLTFASAFQNASNYVLSISSVKDLSGNMMLLYSFPFAFYNATQYDVVINEIMADPEPQVQLPNVEFVELYNRTQFPVSLSGWKFSDASTTVTISNVAILPDSFIVLCASSNVDSFSQNIQVVGLSSFPSLNNTGDQLSLKDNYGNLIHYISYDDTWYNDNIKKNGGWTLEMIDATNPCSGKGNWRASQEVAGGTPGRKNSVVAFNPDTVPPQLLRAVLEDSITLLLYFSETINSSAGSLPANYSVDNNVGVPAVAQPVANDFNTVRLKFPQIFSRGIIYTITVSNISDCSGNTIGLFNSVRFAIPDSVTPGDVVINEILFNPKTYGYDFVELYNRSQKVIDLAQLDIEEKDIANPSSVLELTSVSAQTYLLFPQQYVALTASPENIQQNYFVETPQALVNVPSLPNYADDKSICLLKIHNGVTLDSLAYDHSWHFPLLDIEDGVSLERIDFDKPTQDKNNWHSAASTAGFATPTYKNSQFSETGISEDQINVTPEVFTPDNDGDKDFTFINYKFSETGYTINIRIYDANGREIRNLVRNELLGSEGKFQWDGVDNENQKARIGIYIVYMEVFNLSGKVKKFKKQVVLGAKLY
jgi:hypothetical protein